MNDFIMPAKISGIEKSRLRSHILWFSFLRQRLLSPHLDNNVCLKLTNFALKFLTKLGRNWLKRTVRVMVNNIKISSLCYSLKNIISWFTHLKCYLLKIWNSPNYMMFIQYMNNIYSYIQYTKYMMLFIRKPTYMMFIQ